MRIRAALAALFGSSRAAEPDPSAASLVSQAKASAAGPLMAYSFLGRPVWTERRYDRLAAEGYTRNVVAYRAIQVIARGAASVPWLLYKGEQELDSHPLLALLDRPNPRQSGAALIESLIGYFLIAGNAYLEAVGPEDGTPRELYALRPDRMKIVPGAAGVPAAFEYTVGARVARWAVDPVTGVGPILHLKSFNPLDDWYGLSPIEAAAYAIDQHNAAGAWNQALLQNGARPSGALVFAPKEGPATLGDEQFRRLKEQIEEQFTGARNAGRPLLLEGGLDWREMSLSPKDMDFINTKLTAARDVACAYGVPPMLVGVPGDATYANYREARLALWEDTILPLLDRLTEELNAWLCPQFAEGLKLAYDLDQVSALGPRREVAYARLQGADFLTVNEKREAVGYAPIEGGDALAGAGGAAPSRDNDRGDADDDRRANHDDTTDGEADADGAIGDTADLAHLAEIERKLQAAFAAIDRGDLRYAEAILTDLKGYPEFDPNQPRDDRGRWVRIVGRAARRFADRAMGEIVRRAPIVSHVITIAKLIEVLNYEPRDLETIRPSGDYQEFDTFDEFKDAFGDAGELYEWHHIIEQNQTQCQGINSTKNIVRIPMWMHAIISSYYSKKTDYSEGMTVRQWLKGKTCEEQYAYGIDRLREFKVIK